MIRERILVSLRELQLKSLEVADRRIIRETLRTLIARHRQFDDADWTLATNILKQLQEVLESFEIEDPLEKYSWLFANTPMVIAVTGDDWAARQTLLLQERSYAVEYIYKAGGIPLLLQFAEQVEQPGEIGVRLAYTDLLSEEDLFICENILSVNTAALTMVQSYIRARTYSMGLAWVEDKLNKLVVNLFTTLEQTAFLLCLPPTSANWRIVHQFGEDVQQSYWRQLPPWGMHSEDAAQAAHYFLMHNQPSKALEAIIIAIHSHASNISAELATIVLEKLFTVDDEPNLNSQSLSYNISKLLDHIEFSGEIDETRICLLEIKFLPLLERHSRGPKLLHREIAKNANFFVDVLRVAFRFRGKDDSPKAVSPEEYRQSKIATDLLHSWRRVPGLLEDGTIDEDHLHTWVITVRELAQVSGHEDIADEQIGTILANAPKDEDGSWPSASVRAVIEEVHSESLEHGFMVRVFNGRGAVWRAIAEGGGQERQLAETYREYARLVQESCPRTAAMMMSLSSWYINEAHREDLQADLEEDLWR